MRLEVLIEFFNWTGFKTHVLNSHSNLTGTGGRYDEKIRYDDWGWVRGGIAFLVLLFLRRCLGAFQVKARGTELDY
jgi:hypothetical protein